NLALGLAVLHRAVRHRGAAILARRLGHDAAMVLGTLLHRGLRLGFARRSGRIAAGAHAVGKDAVDHPDAVLEAAGLGIAGARRRTVAAELGHAPVARRIVGVLAKAGAVVARALGQAVVLYRRCPGLAARRAIRRRRRTPGDALLKGRLRDRAALGSV